MSGSSSQRSSHMPTDPPQSSIHATISQQLVERRLERIFRDIFPTAPYLLRIHPHPQFLSPFESFWQRDTHFDEDEEELQFLTFRRNFDHTILNAHGQWDDENGNIAPPEDPISQSSSARTPMPGQTPRRKITLAEYSKRDKTRPKTAGHIPIGATFKPFKPFKPIQPIIPSGPVAPRSPDDEAVNAMWKIIEEDGPLRRQIRDEGEEHYNILHRRSQEAVASSETAANVDSVPPQKQARTSPEHTSPHPEAEQIRRSSVFTSLDPDDEITWSHTPRLAKPTIPKVVLESLKKKKSQLAQIQAPVLSSAPHGLLPMISPTLPSPVVAEVAERERHRHAVMGHVRDDNHLSSATPMTSASETRPGSSSEAVFKKPSPVVFPTKGGPAAKVKAVTIPTITDKGASTTKLAATSAAGSQPIQGTTKPGPAHPIPTKSLIVKLQIKSKSGRKQLSQYLRLKPTPSKGLLSNKADKSDMHTENEKASGISKPHKRQASQDEDGSNEPLAKRRKIPGLVPQKTQDPKLHVPPTSSSSRPTNSQDKRLQATVTSLKSIAMSRTESQDSVPTPVKPSRDASPHTTTKGDSQERRLWKSNCRKEANKFIALATNIKHDSDKYLKQQNTHSDQKKLGVVIAAESVLCFVLAGMISDEPYRIINREGNQDLWKSTREFVHSLASNHGRPFQHLYGFLQQLEGLIGDTLDYHNETHVAAVFREYYKLKGREEAGEVANAEEYITQFYHRLLKETHNNRTLSRIAWREGDLALYHMELALKFPETWGQQRSYPGRGKGRDPVYLYNYAKDGFALPMGPNTTGLEAVNFGLAFLKEFCEKDDLDWQPKLDITN